MIGWASNSGKKSRQMCMEGIPCVVKGNRAEGYPCNRNHLLVDDIIDRVTAHSYLKVE